MVSGVQKNEEYLIQPDVIYNRADLFAKKYEVLKITENDSEINLEVEYLDNEAILGIWLLDISVRMVEQVSKYIFEHHKEIKTIKYEYALSNYGVSYQKNHYRIELPETEDDLRKRLSSKGRYNIKREKRLLDEQLGGYEIVEYDCWNVPEQVVTDYFQMKEATHHVNYHMTPKEYLDKYHVTDIYVLKLHDINAAILLSCEQCKVTYIENLTYDLNYTKYSLGQILYDVYLTRLIEKGKKDIFLAGGDLDYKKRYGSIEDIAYNGIIFRKKIDEIIYKAKQNIKRFLK